MSYAQEVIHEMCITQIREEVAWAAEQILPMPISPGLNVIDQLSPGVLQEKFENAQKKAERTISTSGGFFEAMSFAPTGQFKIGKRERTLRIS